MSILASIAKTSIWLTTHSALLNARVNIDLSHRQPIILRSSHPRPRQLHIHHPPIASTWSSCACKSPDVIDGGFRQTNQISNEKSNRFAPQPQFYRAVVSSLIKRLLRTTFFQDPMIMRVPNAKYIVCLDFFLRGDEVC